MHLPLFRGAHFFWCGKVVSRVLCPSRATAISLRRASLPRLKRPSWESAGGPPSSAIGSCTRWGLPDAACFHAAWCALTAPFHPDLRLTVRAATRRRRSGFCGTVRQLRAFPDVSPSGGSLAAQPLAGILPYGARTFLTLGLTQGVAVFLPALRSVADVGMRLER
jgi:hypothetical protein